MVFISVKSTVYLHLLLALWVQNPHWPNSQGQLSCPLVPTSASQCAVSESQVGFGARVDRDCPELSPHAQVLPNHSHQSHASNVDEPPGQSSWKVGVVDPAANHVEEVDRDGEIQALLPSADKKPQAEGTGEILGQTQVRINMKWCRVGILNVL